MDRLVAMEVLLAAVDGGSLSAASRSLRLPLPTVSRRITELEAHLGATLLIRSAKGLDLTPAGRSFVRDARTILEQVSEAERAAAGEYARPRGDLTITAPVMFGRLHVLPTVTRFLSVYREVAVELMLTDRIARFADGPVDVALRVGALPDSALIAIRLGTVRRLICASPAYLVANGTPAAPADLERHTVISFDGIAAPTTWCFRSGADEVAASFRSRFGVDTIDAAIEAGLQNAGLIRAYSYQVVDHLRGGRLTAVLQEFEPRPSPVHLVYQRRGRLPQKLRAFVDFAVPVLRERLAEAEP